MYKFRIYIVEGSWRSSQAVDNLRSCLDIVIKGEYELKVIDVFSNIITAERDNVFATPTAVRVSPHPQHKIIGNMSDSRSVLFALGLGELLTEKKAH